jgi:signal peptide peptidase SppA
VISGVALIPICGILVHKRTWWSWDEITYDEIAQSIIAALADDEVRGIAFAINSPGGEVAGCFDMCDAIYALRGTKPMLAVADEACYSAAYAIASAADRVVLPRTGGVGSVGVIAMHMDITKMLDDAGIRVTTIQYGDRKSDSYPTTPLSDEAQARMQADVDRLGELFVAQVARNRGLKRSAVRDTEAACFMGETAVEVGLADEVTPVDRAVLDFIDEVNS